jgi:chromosomal replication initiator protein
LVDSALVDLLPRQKEIQPKEVIKIVSELFGVPAERILGRDRTRKVALPRQIVMYLLREEANISLPQIGDTLGGRDHTTVMYGCDKIADLIERDEKVRRQVVKIREQLYSQPAMAI